MKSILFVFTAFFLTTNLSFGQIDTEKLMNSNYSPSYEEMVKFYKDLADKNEDVLLLNMGVSDYGLPIYLCLLNVPNDSIKAMEKARSTTTVLINNAIHPGEPCGVNASMQVASSFANEMPPESKANFPVTAIVTAYNVGGMKNRGSFSRANQNGPEEHGFRGNAQNLDLNRDFIKMDSENMFTFAAVFQALNPDIFVDTHTSNGADYQYTMTYIAPIKEKLAPSIKSVIYDDMIPHLHENMPKKWNYDLVTYVNLRGKTLDEGIIDYNATPRYSMGYADLFNCISFTTETHMLKPFDERVRSTYGFLLEIIGYAMNHSEEIEKARTEAFKFDQNRSTYPSNFQADTVPDSILFKGYEWKFIESMLTDEKRLKYYQDKPFEKYIPHYKNFHATDTLNIPSYFIVQRQEVDVIECLQANGVEMILVEEDSLLKVKNNKVLDYSTASKPYEGHYLHSNIKIVHEQTELKLKKGDVIISTNQSKRTFITHVLSPNFRDSYFAWNFFDSYLQQKEYFSPYVFEEIAVDLLKNDDVLRKKYQAEFDVDSHSSRWEQLYYIYKNSPHYEPTHNVLPIYFVD
jgi:hypothetical protein